MQTGQSSSASNIRAKREEARESLPEELRPFFDLLVAEYQFFAKMHYQRPFVSYVILADLVKNGWRPPVGARLSESADSEPAPPHSK